MTRHLTRRAEEAVLGAALLRPELLPSLRWIPPGTFSRADHAALWRVLHSLDLSAVPVRRVTHSWSGPAPVAYRDMPTAVNRAVADLDPGIRSTLTPPHLAELAASCPNPGTAPLYGGMTVESAIHRAVEDAGGKLRDTARRTDIGRAPEALALGEQTGERLSALGRAWASVPEPVRAQLDAPTEATVTPPDHERARVDREAESSTVASLLYQPAQLREIPWLSEQDFTDTELASTFSAMRRLDARGAPVDPLTVAWEAARRPGHSLSDRALQDLERAGQSGQAAFTGEQVLRTAALDRLDKTGGDLRTYALHPALAPTGLLDHAGRALGPLSHDRERVMHAEHGSELAPADAEPAPPARQPPALDYEMEMDL
ncbi:DnaB-like helicase N-terminal domain-containing protein [Streptomyces sp. NPDC001054]